MLDQKKKKRLKAQAHRLHAVVTIGDKGLSDAVQNEIGVALMAHELIKIRITGSDKAARQALAAQICVHHQAELVMTIGHIVIIYKHNDDA